MAEVMEKDPLDLDDAGYETEDTQKDKFLTFFLADEDYGIAIHHVIEIIGIQKITEVPDMPNFVKGVINLRGKVIPVMDVRARFRLPAQAYDERTCIIVVNVDEQSTGLIVDRVCEVADIPSENVEPAPGSGKGNADSYIMGLGKVGDRVKILLDARRLLAI